MRPPKAAGIWRVRENPGEIPLAAPLLLRTMGNLRTFRRKRQFGLTFRKTLLFCFKANNLRNGHTQLPYLLEQNSAMLMESQLNACHRAPRDLGGVGGG